MATTTTMPAPPVATPMVAAEMPGPWQAATPTVIFPVDPADPPLAQADPDGLLEIELAGPGGLLTLQFPVDRARAFTAEIFSAVSVAYRQATGDPHALTDDELAALPHPDRYVRDGGTLVEGSPDEPAQVRFHIAITLEGQTLSTATLAEAIIDHLTGRFATVEVRIDHGTPLAGTTRD